MEKHYITAVVSLLLQGSDVDVVLGNLKTVLVKNGHEQLHTRILKGAERELLHREALHSSSIVVAKETDLRKLRSALSAALGTLGGNAEEAAVTVDPSIIGGFIAAHDGKLINRSYKERLVSLYQSITT